MSRGKSRDIAKLVQGVADSFESDYVGTFSGDNAMDLVEEWIPSTSHALNYMGGDPKLGLFPQGKIIEIYGPRSSSKSLILYDAIANCQKMGGIGILEDSESSFHKGWGKYIGVDFDRLLYSQSSTLSEAHDFMRKSVEKIRKKGFEGPIALGWDSIAASPFGRESGEDFEDGKSEMGTRARENSKFMRICASEFAQQNVTCIFLNQIRKKIGVMFGKDETRPGGEAIPLHASICIEVRRTKKLTAKGTKRIMGHLTKVYFEKNKVRPPFSKGNITIFTDRVNRRYGLDPWSGLVDILVEDEVLYKEDKKLILSANTDVRFYAKDISEHWKDEILPVVCEDPYGPVKDSEGAEETNEKD